MVSTKARESLAPHRPWGNKARNNTKKNNKKQNNVALQKGSANIGTRVVQTCTLSKFISFEILQQVYKVGRVEI